MHSCNIICNKIHPYTHYIDKLKKKRKKGQREKGKGKGKRKKEKKGGYVKNILCHKAAGQSENQTNTAFVSLHEEMT